MNRTVWKASGHEETFSDPMVDCLLTKKRFRADQIEPQSGTVLHFAGAIDEKLLRETFDYSFDDIDEPRRRELEKHYRQCKNLDELTKHPDADVAEFAKKRLGQIARPIRVDEPFSVFLPKGKPPESARKVAVQYYQQRGLANPTLSGERTEKVENTIQYNPENGSLLTEPRAFNLMFKTYVGATEDESSITYLRPETAQSIFVQFKNILEVSRK